MILRNHATARDAGRRGKGNAPFLKAGGHHEQGTEEIQAY